MLRRLLFTFAVMLPCWLQAQDAASAPQPAKTPPVPMAVKALEYLKAQRNSGPMSWTNGPYVYDGEGNVQAIGPETYVYDKIGRLKSSTLRGPDLSSMQTQSFDYDAYGNLTSTTKLGQTVPLLITGTTNRLSSFGYDASGNVIAAGTQHYDYDAVGMVNAVRVGTNVQPRIIYAYTADDERLFAFDVQANTTHWTLRGFDNKILRDFKQNGSAWSVERDYVYRGGSLLAALKPGGAVEHYSLDQLGTPRLVTNGAGQKVGYHVYWPFGEEWSPGTAQENSPLKFTGHERDVDPSGGNAPLDYMHARFYMPAMGRFLSVDPTWSSADFGKPQSWNRYSYVMNNPVNRSDPDGKCPDGCVVEIALLAAAFAAVTGTEVTLQAPSVTVPGKTNAQALGSSIGTAIGNLGDSIVKGIRHMPAIAPPGYGGGADPMPPIMSQQETFLPELPGRDRTGKVHGELPTPADLRQYPTEDLKHFQDELKGSVGQRIEVTAQKGRDQTHGERQAAEQRLIKQIDKIVEDREPESQ